jgi:hypothetical protein
MVQTLGANNSVYETVYYREGIAGFDISRQNTSGDFTTITTFGVGGIYFNRTVYTPDGTVSKSDANQKNSISSLPIQYSTLFDNLNPVLYKYNHGTSNRYHVGFIAQEVK